MEVKQNILYLIKKLWQWDRRSSISIFVQIPVSVLCGIIGIYLPKVMIAELEQPTSFSRMIGIVLAMTMLLIIMTRIDKRLEAIIHWGSHRFRMEFMKLLMWKMCDTDYQNLEDDLFKRKCQEYANENATQWGEMEKVIPTIRSFGCNLLGFLIYSIMIINVTPILILLVIITALINAFCLKKYREFEERIRIEVAKADRENGYALSKANDFSAGKDIRLYQMKTWILEIYNRCIKRATTLRDSMCKRRMMCSLVDYSMVLLRDVIAYGYLIRGVLNHEMAISDFVLYLGVIAGLSGWFSKLIQDVHEFGRISRVTSAMRSLLNFPDAFNRGDGVEVAETSGFPYEIIFNHVTYKYPNAEKPTICDFNLTIQRGEKLAIVGINGAGKTTLIKLLCGFYMPTSGNIQVNGKDIREYNRDEYYKLITAVFQDVKFLPTSIENNMTSYGGNKVINTEETKNERIWKCLELSGMKKKIENLELGLDTKLGKGIIEHAIDFSGGEAQRIILSRALYKEAPILILDEPTAALDPIAEQEMYLRYAQLANNKTSLFISHRLSSTKFCDRIVLVENGHIQEMGTHDELLEAKGKYAEIYELQSYYYKENINQDEVTHNEMVGDKIG